MTTKRKKNIEPIVDCFNLYEKKLYHIAYQILHDTYLAEDAVMAAFEKLLKKGVVIDNPESDKTKRMMIVVIRSVAIDMYRKNKRLLQNEGFYDENAEPASDDELLLKACSKDTLSNMIDSLPEKLALVLYERFYNELSVKETAEELGITETAVRKRQQRGIELLRKKLSEVI